MNSISLLNESLIHSTAIIDKSAQIEDGVKIGAYSIIGKNVKIAKNTTIHSHVLIENSVIGENCEIFNGAIIGSDSQDLKSTSDISYVVLGNNNVIREYVTINRSSFAGEKTIIGNNNLLMAYVHIAHDCIIGDKNILSNSVNLGGHCIIENNCVIGGLTGLHQFVRVGSYSMIGGLTRVNQDVPPFFTTVGNPAKVEGVNIKGLKRHNFSREKINYFIKSYKIIYCSNLTLNESLEQIKKDFNDIDILYLIDFLEKKSKRGLIGLNFRNISNTLNKL